VARWTALPLDRLPALAEAWQAFDFFASIPRTLQGRLLLEVNRNSACLVELPALGLLFLLRMRSPALWLENDSGKRIRAIAGQQVRHTNAWILALQPGQADNFPAGVIEFAPGGGLLVGGLPLRQMRPFRPWSWKWSPTCGCAFLTVHVDRNAGEIREWLRTAPHLEPNADRKPAIRDGAISFSTPRFRGLSRTQAARDQTILAPLAEGALGELSFDLFDSDYGKQCAKGRSCAELAAYLDPAYNWKGD
jgi:hypothetical protein